MDRISSPPRRDWSTRVSQARRRPRVIISKLRRAERQSCFAWNTARPLRRDPIAAVAHAHARSINGGVLWQLCGSGTRIRCSRSSSTVVLRRLFYRAPTRMPTRRQRRPDARCGRCGSLRVVHIYMQRPRALAASAGAEAFLDWPGLVRRPVPQKASNKELSPLSTCNGKASASHVLQVGLAVLLFRKRWQLRDRTWPALVKII